MQEILTISQYIITIWWAIIILLLIVICFLVIKLLIKLNHRVDDVREKYNLMMWFLFKPFNIIKHLISKIK